MKRRGFTLIELLAVIIILGILLLIAIPGVTGYINNSRKNVYVDTAKELVKGTSKLLNSGDFDTLDEDVTYYMDSRCISNESSKEAQSPFGKFNPAYVLVVNENDEYNYYFQSRDETEVGVKDITKMDDLQISKIVFGVKEEDIDTSVGIGSTTKTAIIDENCHVGEAQPASRRVSMNGESMITLTFDNQGGTGCDMQSQYYGEEWGKLCKPKKEGWKFIGWYTKPNKLGDKITKTSKAEKSMTVYAAWTDQYAKFDTGMIFNAKIKKLVGQQYANYNKYNTTITSIIKSEFEPNTEEILENNIVSSSDSAIPIYIWLNESSDIVYWWSEDEEPVLNQDSSYMFNLFKAINNIDLLDIVDTSYVTNMAYMFDECIAMTEIDLSNWDTSKVTNMGYMFYKCRALKSVDLSSFDTNKVTNMDYMFSWCDQIFNLDLNSFTTTNLSSMLKIFYYCSNLRTLDIDNFDTSKVTDLSETFYCCRSLIELNLSSFNTVNVTNMISMFSGCFDLTELDLGDFFNTSNVTNMSFMFCACKKLATIDVSSFNTQSVTKMSNMFAGCSLLTVLDVSNFITSNVTSMASMFSGCSSVTVLDVSHFNTANVTSMASMFSGCSSVTVLDVSHFNTANVTSMVSMFAGCSSVTVLDVSHFNTTNVTTMVEMFMECKKMTSINVNNFNTSNVTDMNYMFYSCEKIQSIDVSHFNTSNVTDLTGMFAFCIGLDSLDLSSFNTSSLTKIGAKRMGVGAYSGKGMFEGCSNLSNINLSSFNTSNVVYYGSLFAGCSSLTTIDISSFSFDSATDLHGMFSKCSNLETIYVNNSINTSQIVWSMDIFKETPNLVGGAGTTWNSNMADDISKAHIDGGVSNPGLFTQKV